MLDLCWIYAGLMLDLCWTTKIYIVRHALIQSRNYVRVASLSRSCNLKDLIDRTKIHLTESCVARKDVSLNLQSVVLARPSMMSTHAMTDCVFKNHTLTKRSSRSEERRVGKEG